MNGDDPPYRSKGRTFDLPGIGSEGSAALTPMFFRAIPSAAPLSWPTGAGMGNRPGKRGAVSAWPRRPGGLRLPSSLLDRCQNI